MVKFEANNLNDSLRILSKELQENIVHKKVTFERKVKCLLINCKYNHPDKLFGKKYKKSIDKYLLACYNFLRTNIF